MVSGIMTDWYLVWFLYSMVFDMVCDMVPGVFQV